MFTGIIAIQDKILTEWTWMGEPNYYLLVDKDDIFGPRALLSVNEWLDEMSQYDGFGK